MTGPMSSTARGLGVAVVLPLLLALHTACGGSGETPKSPRVAAAAAPDKALTAGTCWDDEQLPAALGAVDFDAWVKKYADGDATLGNAMRDDAAFSKKLDCSEAHALELYDVVSLDPALTARVTSYSDLLDQDSALYR
jgi:hypothetical protein